MDNKTSDESAAFAKTLDPIPGGRGGRPVSLGYVEFDDQGEMWRMNNQDGGTTQLIMLLKDLKEKSASGPLKVVVFIHGWNNNASPGNETEGNLASFKKMLTELDRSSGTPIYGVYVAWRGTSWPYPTGIDLWDRDAAAKRIGGPTMLTALRSISATARRNANGSVVMVGHSFGGKILTQVTSQHLAGEIGRALGEDGTEITPLADTVVVINSATNSQEMRQVNELMQTHKITYRRGGLNVPLFVTIASESDFPVRSLLPIYLRFNRDVLAFPDRSGHVANRKENDALYRAMGHNADLLNFEFTGSPRSYPRIPWTGDEPLKEIVSKNFRNGARATNDGLDLWLQTSTDQASGKAFRLVPKHISPDGYQSPHWGFTVPDFAVSDHSGLWQPNFVALVSALDGMARPSVRAQVTTPKPKLQIQRQIYDIPTE
ncbi:hypothetical protein JIN84_13410 [Luteolibacter yonseiensis]|uniref:Alpha/beta hydrolase n=1 Tax=Luteolibacter yonseiensis TaxID=1144680 RepID=A0A934R592_9BACT|nr:hypothetical protein [Luteolibacter yonseiensis]MBK1816617.1 hypothetical protein [Luteolibacter yonseiensis]